MAQHIRGERGGNLVLYNGFIYKKKYQKGGKYHTCNEDGCAATLYLQANALIVIQNAGVHMHPPPGEMIASTTILEEAKQRIDADPTRHLPRIWEEVLDW